MNEQVYRIEFYERPSGRIPVLDWIDGLKDPTTKRRLLGRLRRVRQGNLGDWKPIDRDLFELIFDFGAGYRIYCSKRGGTIVLLLGGSRKNDQRRGIDRARKDLAEYKQRVES